MGNYTRWHAGHDHVLERLAGDLAESAGRHRQRRANGAGWTSDSRRGEPRTTVGARLPDQYGVFYPDAVVHGIEAPAALFHRGDHRQCDGVCPYLRDYHRGRRSERTVWFAGSDEKAARYRQRRSVVRIYSVGDFLFAVLD